MGNMINPKVELRSNPEQKRLPIIVSKKFAYLFVVFLAAMSFSSCKKSSQPSDNPKGEGGNVTPSSKSTKPADDNPYTASIRDLMQKVTDAELNDFATKYKSNQSYEGQRELVSADRKKVVPLVLAAQKKFGSEYTLLIQQCYVSDKIALFKLSPEEQQEQYRYCLAYLTESLNILPGTNSDTEGLQDIQAMLKSHIAEAALGAGNMELAIYTAKEMLSDNKDIKSWNYGNVIHQAHTIMGRAALQKNDLKTAKIHLLESGKTPGSPQLNSFGPSFILARELLEKGEKDVVIEYLDLIAVFWANTGKLPATYKQLAEEHAGKISKWKQEIKAAGTVPSDMEWKR
jgi:hypothetical protein